ncbi:MAG: hypothetical protein ABI220_00495 [Candidatus Saccharimonadales bacterium]
MPIIHHPIDTNLKTHNSHPNGPDLNISAANTTDSHTSDDSSFSTTDNELLLPTITPSDDSIEVPETTEDSSRWHKIGKPILAGAVIVGAIGASWLVSHFDLFDGSHAAATTSITPEAPDETSPAAQESTSKLQPTFVEVASVDNTNASVVLETLLGNVFIAEETGNTDGYKAAYVQVSPDSYGPMQNMVENDMTYTPAFIAGLALDSSYPVSTVKVDSIQSVSAPDSTTGDVTIGATTNVARVIPQNSEGTTQPTIQYEKSKAAYVVGMSTVTNFKDGVSRDVIVIKQIYPSTTEILNGPPEATS